MINIDKGIYTTFDIEKIFKIPRERLRVWMDLGYVTPCVPSKSQGRRALFSQRNVIDIMVFKTLIDKIGMRRSVAVQYIRRDQ